ncbi:MAG: hypothetical protein AB1758_14015, partial [Candidatus Eremiobacterota bacterium]
FATRVLLSPEFQQVASPLCQLSHELARLCDSAPTLLHQPGESNDSAVHSLNGPHLLAQLSRMARGQETGLLDSRYREQLLGHLDRLIGERKMQFPETVPELRKWTDSVKPNPDDRHPEIRQAASVSLESLRQHCLQVHEGRLREALDGWLPSRAPEDGKEPLTVLRDYQAVRAELGLSPGLPQDLGGQLRTVLLDVALNPGAPSDSFPAGSLDPGYARTLLQCVRDPGLQPSQRALLENWLLSQVPFSACLPEQGERAEFFRELTASLGDLTPDRVRQALRHSDRHSQRLGEILSRSLGRPVDRLDGATYQELFRKPGLPEEVQEESGRLMVRDANLRLGLLNLVARDPELSRRFLAGLTFEEVRGLAREVNDLAASVPLALLRTGTRRADLSVDVRRLLMDGLAATQDQAPDLASWQAVLQDVRGYEERLFTRFPAQRRQLSSYAEEHMARLPAQELERQLGRDDNCPSPLLPQDAFGRLLARTVSAEEPDLKARLDALTDDFALDRIPEERRAFQEALAERLKLQPADVARLFGEETEPPLADRASGATWRIRGLSALVAATRPESPPERLQMVGYLLGQRKDPPSFLEELGRDLKQRHPGTPDLVAVVAEVRHALGSADVAGRTLVADSLMAGPQPLLGTAQGRELVLESLLQPVRPERRALARMLAENLLEAHHPNESLVVAYLMANQRGGEGAPLSEGAVLSGLFDAYGVPGIKLKQYLAFTSAFAEFRQDFEAAQDSAMPLSFLETLRLVRHHHPEGWPEHLRIDEVKGSGSVNVAVRYHDARTGEAGVLSMPRAQVERTARYDFWRLERFLTALTSTPENREQFGFLLGLSQVIRRSVSLEFDRQAAFEMQQSVQRLYHREVDGGGCPGWKVRTVAAHEIHGGAIRMQEAPGKTARRVLNEDPATYRSAMGALARVELDVLLGVDQSGRPGPVPLHANPDFHDGQVLIDPETRTVTLLDFGQAVPIDNSGRDYALDLVGVLGGAYPPQEASRLLSKRTGVEIAAGEVQALLDQPDRMDAFIRLLALVEERGAQVPLPVVHWVLAMHRLQVLGTKIERPIDGTLRDLVATRRVGGNLALFNHIRQARDGTAGPIGQLVFGPLGSLVSSLARRHQEAA